MYVQTKNCLLFIRAWIHQMHNFFATHRTQSNTMSLKFILFALVEWKEKFQSKMIDCFWKADFSKKLYLLRKWISIDKFRFSSHFHCKSIDTHTELGFDPHWIYYIESYGSSKIRCFQLPWIVIRWNSWKSTNSIIRILYSWKWHFSSLCYSIKYPWCFNCPLNAHFWGILDQMINAFLIINSFSH